MTLAGFSVRCTFANFASIVTFSYLICNVYCNQDQHTIMFIGCDLSLITRSLHSALSSTPSTQELCTRSLCVCSIVLYGLCSLDTFVTQYVSVAFECCIDLTYRNNPSVSGRRLIALCYALCCSRHIPRAIYRFTICHTQVF